MFQPAGGGLTSAPLDEYLPLMNFCVGQNPKPNTARRLSSSAFTATVLVALVLLGAASGRAQVFYEKLKDFGVLNRLGDAPVDSLLRASDGALYGVTYFGGKAGVGTLFKVNQDGTGYTVLHHFGEGNDGQRPDGGVMEAADGFLYGTTSSGPVFGQGVIYRITKNGSAYEVLYRCDGAAGGSSPSGRLIQGSDGALYGTTAHGGTNANNSGAGLVFRLDMAATNFSVLHYFSDGDGRIPSGALVQGSDGALYGTTHYGGGYDNGVVFTLRPDGSSFSVLRTFSWGDGQGQFPNELMEGTDGVLYGTTSYGGGSGKIFKLNKSGTGFVSYDLPSGGLTQPYGQLVEGADGFMYGTTYLGGTYKQGGVFRIAKNGDAYHVLHQFGSVPDDGSSVFSGLTKGDSGALFGNARGGRSGAGIIFKVTPATSDYTIITHLSRTGGDASSPTSKLVQSADGRLCGVASYGGSANLGAVFRLGSDGAGYEILHEFGVATNEGAHPMVLLSGNDSSLYGATSSGGSTGYGTLFRITGNGTFTVLHSFGGTPSDGNEPSGLCQASDGFLYGITKYGGTSNLGTIFKLTTNGQDYTILRSLGASEGDAAQPASGLIEASDGVLYGAALGGVTNYLSKIFSVNKNGTGYRVILELPFEGIEGAGSSELLEGSDGWLYATQTYAAAPYNGAIYKCRKDGTGFTVLHAFIADGTEGVRPMAGLIEAGNGLLYGTTSDQGGGGGSLFQMAKDGTGFAALHSFGSITNDGLGPTGALMEARDGRLYGTTSGGGESSLGSVFCLTTVDLTRVNLAATNGTRVLYWNAVDGVTYGVQWRSNLTTSVWQDLPGDILATGADASKVDAEQIGPQRFYRVIKRGQ